MEKGIRTSWHTEDLVLFGMWLINRREYGHGLLCIHGACLGVKLKSLLQLKWEHFLTFVDETEIYSLEEFSFKDGNRSYDFDLSPFIQRINEETYFKMYENLDFVHEDTPMYVNSKTKKVLTTSSLNRELRRFQKMYQEEISNWTAIKFELNEIKTNALELAWARDMVNHYKRTKKSFIAVSKWLGHRTVNDTINLLQITPEDEIEYCTDIFNPTKEVHIGLDDVLRTHESAVMHPRYQDINSVNRYG